MMEYVALANGVSMPMVGYGTYRTPNARTEDAVSQAIGLGYRLIDTAQCYGNEEGVGRAIASCSVARDELFITTKTWTNGYRDTVASIDRSLRDLQTNYVDLLLIHEPTGDVPGIWRALEETYRAGKARSIGVSNFIGPVLDDILDSCDVVPMVNQVETHPLRQQQALLDVCRNHGIVMQSWSPLVAGNRGVLGDGTIRTVAEAHKKTPAQVVLRWLVQRGIPTVPKSMSTEHMRQNLDIFDFTLSDKEMVDIAALDTDRSQFGWW